MSGKSLITSVCPHCKKDNVVRGKALTLAMTCQHCSTYFTRGNWTEVDVKFNDTTVPVIPIGSKGKIEGNTYEVMGFVVKYVRKYRFKWREYTLFNPVKGLAFLSESEGHWNFVKPLKDDPKGEKRGLSFNYNAKEFRLFQKYKAEIVFAKGEFCFDIFSGTAKTLVEEYIAPPYLLSLESDSESYRWYEGTYMANTDVASAFSLNVKTLPPKEGRGYTQPFISAFSKESLMLLCFLLGAALFAIQIFLHATSKDKIVFEQSFSGNTLKEGQKMFVTSSFELEGESKSLVMELYAPLYNDWFFGDFVLVNENDNSEYEFSKEIEYYSGNDGGEAWSEGSKKGAAFLSRIPAGRYHMNIYPEFTFSNKEFSITLIRDVSNMSNFWVTLLVLSIFPIFYFIRHHHIESSRWSDSDYSPYDE